jgi:hypothetical protein
MRTTDESSWTSTHRAILRELVNGSEVPAAAEWPDPARVSAFCAVLGARVG